MFKFKNIVSFFLILCLCLSFMTACGNNEGQNESTDNNPTSSNTSTETPDTTTPEDNKEPTKQELCEEALANIKAYVLNVDVVDYDDAYINGYGAYSTDYEKATVITIGLTFPEGAYNQYWERMSILGETATDSNGKTVPQTLSSAGWISDDRTYAVLLCRVAGEVDVSKVDVLLKSKVDEISRETKFENNGEEVGFEAAKEKFTKSNDTFGTGNYIIELKGRHYFIIRRYCSSTSSVSNSEGRFSTRTESFVLMPLEGGLTPSLTKEDVNLVSEKEVENTFAKLMVNENGQIDKSTLKCQTTIEVEVWREYVEETLEDGTYSKEVYEAVSRDEKELLEACSVEIDDGNGNTIKLYFK